MTRLPTRLPMSVQPANRQVPDPITRRRIDFSDENVV